MALTIPVLLGVLLASGGQAPSYDPDAAPAELRPAIAKADRAFSELRQALLARLSAALSDGGPLSAVSVCHDAAPEVAARVRTEQGMALGRTSHRLRNPENRSPAWAAAHVAAAGERPGADARPLVVDLGDRVGVLRPIHAMPMCTSCHGPAEQISPDLKETLAALYPADRATGFREGDLRGWMWAEVTKTAFE